MADQMHMVVWKYTMRKLGGEQYVTLTGLSRMLTLFADSWGLRKDRIMRK